MKTIARISAITALLSVAGLESKGPWAWAALIVGLAAAAALFASCARLGYFVTPVVHEERGRVVSLDDRRRPVGHEARDEAPLKRQAGARGR